MPTLVGVPVISVDSTTKNRAIFRPAGCLPLTTRQVNGVGPDPPLDVIAWFRNVPTLPVPRSQTPLVQLSPAVLMVSGSCALAGPARPRPNSNEPAAMAATRILFITCLRSSRAFEVSNRDLRPPRPAVSGARSRDRARLGHETASTIRTHDSLHRRTGTVPRSVTSLHQCMTTRRSPSSLAGR